MTGRELGASMGGMRRFFSVLGVLVVAAVSAAPADARGSDPLLSGYAGPGGGDQTLLGSTLIPRPRQGGTGDGGGRSLEASAPAARSADPASTPPAQPAARSGSNPVPAGETSEANAASSGAAPSGKDVRGRAGRPGEGSRGDGGGSRIEQGSRSGGRRQAAGDERAATAATEISYPETTMDSGWVPLGNGALAGLLIGMLLVLGVAVLTARTADHRPLR